MDHSLLAIAAIGTRKALVHPLAIPVGLVINIMLVSWSYGKLTERVDQIAERTARIEIKLDDINKDRHPLSEEDKYREGVDQRLLRLESHR